MKLFLCISPGKVLPRLESWEKILMPIFTQDAEHAFMIGVVFNLGFVFKAEQWKIHNKIVVNRRKFLPRLKVGRKF